MADKYSWPSRMFRDLEIKDLEIKDVYHVVIDDENDPATLRFGISRAICSQAWGKSADRFGST
jgi:hypothetical protein